MPLLFVKNEEQCKSKIMLQDLRTTVALEQRNL